MDPTTTLVTFLLQTNPSVQAVHLLGSWDNFATSYPMERDSRRGKDQWKGCHAFQNIICDDDSSQPQSLKRNGGLKMGHTYYYYYEVDGSTDTYDPTKPTTTNCPYLPGQTVNALTVPVQQSLRQRSVSLSSMRLTDYATMNPRDKFNTPRPVPAAPSEVAKARHGTAPCHRLRPSTSSASLSPAPERAWKKWFGHKPSSENERGRSTEKDERINSTNSRCSDRSMDSSNGSRNRSMSPRSLRRFLTEDYGTRPGSGLSDRPSLVIPEDIDEENEDDDNFASAVSESSPFSFGLSPPPPRTAPSTSSSGMMPLTSKNLSSLTLTTERPSTSHAALRPSGSTGSPDIPSLDTFSQPISSTSSALATPLSSQSPDNATLTFYYDTEDDQEETASKDESIETIQEEPHTLRPLRSKFSKYTLPEYRTNLKPVPESPRYDYLAQPIDTGLDDFASEMGWMVESIGTKRP